MKLFVHPVFFLAVAAAVWYSAGTFMVALILAVLIHELCHAAAAASYGIRPTRLALLPFGGVISIDCAFLSARQKNIVLLSGPAGNFVAAVILGVLIWLFPVAFIYLEYLAAANLITGVMNLLPITGLDGGRVLSNYTGAKPIMWFSNIVFAALLFVSLYMTNYFVSAFAIMMLISINFTRTSTVFASKIRQKIGALYECAVSGTQTLFAVYKMVHSSRPTKFIVTDRANRTFYERDLEKWLTSYPVDERIDSVLK